MFLVLYEYDKNKQFFILKTDDLTGFENQQDRYMMIVSTDKDVKEIEDIFYENLNKVKEANKDITEYTTKYMPKMYSPTEVMKQATELYSFVTKKD